MKRLAAGLTLVCWLLFVGVSVAAPAPAPSASHDVYQFSNATLTARFQTLTGLLRCPKCQDNSIGDSQAELALDMRKRTAELLREGKTNQQIVDYFVARYGDFVSFKPPLRWDTVLIWVGPALALLLGLLLVIRQLIKANRHWRLVEKGRADSEIEDN